MPRKKPIPLWFKVTGAALLAVTVAGAGTTAYIVHRRGQPLPRAEALLAANKPRDAIFQLRTAVRDNPRDATAALLLGTAQAQLGEFTAAEREVKRARQLGADRNAVMLLLGSFYLADNRFRDVISELPSTAADAEAVARFLGMRSRASVGLNDEAAAGRALDAARRLNPVTAAARAELLHATARLAVLRKDLAAARTAFAAAVQADPDNVDILQAQAQILKIDGDPAAALAALDRAVALRPALPQARIARATLLMAQGQDAKAAADVRETLTGQPRNAPAIFLSAVLAVRQGQFVAAAEQLDAFGSAARFPRVPYFQALAALGRGMASTAVEYAVRYNNRAPNDPDGIRLLARALAANEQFDRATRVLADAVTHGLTDPLTLDLYGQVSTRAGNPAVATDLYRQALAQAPDEPVLQLGLATAEAQAGNPTAAIETLGKIDAANADRPDVLQALATAQVAAGTLDQAVATLERLRAKAGASEAAGILAATIEMARLQPAEAVATLQATLKAYPASMVARLNLARALVAAGRRDEARKELSDALAAQPTNPEALTGFVQLAIDDNRLNLAVRALDAARRASPNAPGPLAMLADVHVRAGNAAAAIAAIQSASADARQQPVTLQALARAQVAAGDRAAAILTYRQALETVADPQMVVALVGLLMDGNEAARAKAVLDEAIVRIPGQFPLLSRRVEIEAATRTVDAARDLALKLAQTPAQMPAAAVLAGDAMVRAGRPRDAIPLYRAQIKPDTDGPVLASLRLRTAEAQLAASDEAGALATLQGMEDSPDAALLLSQLDIRARRWPEAARRIETALRAHPADPGLLNNLAWAYAESGDPRARATAQRAYLMSPSPDTADTLGWIMVRQNEPAEAVTILRGAAASRPNDPSIAFHLAVALDRAGHRAEAARLLQGALAMNTAFDERAEAKALASQIQSR